MTRLVQSHAPPTCNHETLITDSSSHAVEVGYVRPTMEKRVAATTMSGRVGKGITVDTRKQDVGGRSVIFDDQNSYPAPLVLPGDDLAFDPRYPPQSLRAWAQGKDRNEITSARRTIYVASTPRVTPEVQFMNAWTGDDESIPRPSTQDVVDYLAAFYHGLPVKAMSPTFRYTTWDEENSTKKSSKSKQKSTNPAFVGLATADSCYRVGARVCPDSTFSHQLNLNDLIDVTIEELPEDAYALVLLVQHDIYEDEDDDFACGRAYGGSRVAVVSMARYNPALDSKQGLERDHMWPASHCQAYVQACCEVVAPPRKKARSGKSTRGDDSSSAAPISSLQAALSACRSLPSLDTTSSPSPATLSGVWLSRVAPTVSHELGHCLGIDHCVYNACVMQGSASLMEGARQAPYLCPIDLAKVLRATGGDVVQRYKALLDYCERREDIHLFASFAAWIRQTLKGAEVAEPKTFD